ncbi:xanthine dehydrogenase family protein molybdopterin-binding subunit [Streptomyces barringtoniae]|uniref:xanthine dehydrogenase family protein molybdopterin-binding subunit n=1 Tax=Streptomyces barringtoniae TaxID=2892029 RepID=UPI001E448CA4|nr:xanthine dehydrogenase family protein molybdopterin-binding subunit [Streptomyces barringtoniae]MCC5479332.1 xanthine dehydrogenase family protein molybdopterin-binding subunit [Streptomyces barringtoniae]
MTDQAVEREVGRRRLRKEDARLITGQTNWTDNIQVAGLLHMAILRSPMAHARVTRVDVSPALDYPNVVAAFSGADLAEGLGSLPCAWPVTEDIVLPGHPPVAVDEVRYAGDPVAVVVARDRYAAADALEAIEVDYDPLPPVLDLEAALAEGSPLVHTDKGTNRCYTWPLATGDSFAAVRDRAEVTLKRRYHQQRLIPNAMEPRAVVVTPIAASGEYTVYSATQIPHILRIMLSTVTGIPEHKLRVIAPDVGGGFGSKLQVYGEEALALAIARRLGRPVKWTESRSEGALATHHGRGMIQDVEIAATREGGLLGLKVDLLADMGAYLMLVTPGIPILGAFMYPGIYKMDAYEFTCTGVFTTRTPTDAYRGAGRPEATFAIERIMDELAAELGLDPVELRRRNWIRHEEFPYTSIAGLTYDSGNYEAATDKALALFGYDDLRAEQHRRNERGDPVRLGIGVSTYTEMCGLAPSRVLRDLRYGAGGWEAASIRMLPTGKVEVVTGTSPHGQGHETCWSQIAADVLGVPFEDVEVVHGDTRAAPQGMDTYGSRSLAVGGEAVHRAAKTVVEKARKIAAHLLEASEQDLEFSDGAFSVKGSPEARRTIQEIAFETFTNHDLPDGVEPTINAEHVVDPENFSYPHGTHLCSVEVDTETGRTRIRSYVCVDDVGRVVNPMIVEGQVHGGLAQGIAQALYEEAVYDDDGNLLSGTLADYLVPSAADLPDFVTDRTETPAVSNALGVKGVGEAGTIASTPAVVNAVVDALRPLGVRDVRMPCSPHRVWQAIQEARSGTAGGTGGTGPAQSGQSGQAARSGELGQYGRPGEEGWA